MKTFAPFRFVLRLNKSDYMSSRSDSPPLILISGGGDTERRRLLGLYRRVTVAPQTRRVAERRTAQAAVRLGGIMMIGNSSEIVRSHVLIDYFHRY